MTMQNKCRVAVLLITALTLEGAIQLRSPRHLSIPQNYVTEAMAPLALTTPLFRKTIMAGSLVTISYANRLGQKTIKPSDADIVIHSNEPSVSVGELSNEKSHEKIIEVLAHNYHITLLATSIVHDDSGKLMLRGLQGADAINELNKRFGVQGITREGIADLHAMFKRQLFEALVEMLVAKSTDGYTKEDFDRVNSEIAPYSVRLQDFGIQPPKKQKKHGFGINFKNAAPHSFRLLGYAA